MTDNLAPNKPTDIQHWLRWASQALAGVATCPSQEARWLLMATLDCSASDLIINTNQILTPAQITRLNERVRACRAGQPLAYVLGHWSFYGMSLKVSPDTLVPRPETEGLVTAVLAYLEKQSNEREGAVFRVLDLGTGSGAIALAVAQSRPDTQVLATDKSLAALQIAQANGLTLGLHNVSWACMDWCEALSSSLKFDVIVSNPPYLRSDDPHLQSAIRHEPKRALVSGPSGLEDITGIALAAKIRLAPHGVLMLEHGFDQGAEAREALAVLGFEYVKTLADISGHDRIAVGYLTGRPEPGEQDNG
jgi:release factor glutamine methyltransferase